MSVKKKSSKLQWFLVTHTTKTGHLNLGVYPNSKQTKSQQRPVMQAEVVEEPACFQVSSTSIASRERPGMGYRHGKIPSKSHVFAYVLPAMNPHFSHHWWY